MIEIDVAKVTTDISVSGFVRIGAHAGQLTANLLGKVYTSSKAKKIEYGEAVKPRSFYDQTIDLTKQKMTENGFPFSFNIKDQLSSYQGHYIHVKWHLIAAFIPKSRLTRKLEATKEVSVLVPQPLPPSPAKQLYKFDVKWAKCVVKLDSTHTAINEYITGQLKMIDKKSSVDRIELALMRKETVMCIDGKFTERTQIQVLEVASGNVNEASIPFMIPFLPNVVTSTKIDESYRIEFEITLQFYFEAGERRTEFMAIVVA